MLVVAVSQNAAPAAVATDNRRKGTAYERQRDRLDLLDAEIATRRRRLKNMVDELANAEPGSQSARTAGTHEGDRG